MDTKEETDLQCCVCYGKRCYYMDLSKNHDFSLKQLKSACQMEKHRHELLHWFPKKMFQLINYFLEQSLICLASYRCLFTFLLILYLPVNVFAMQQQFQWLASNDLSFSPEHRTIKSVGNCSLSFSLDSEMRFCDQYHLCAYETMGLMHNLTVSTTASEVKHLTLPTSEVKHLTLPTSSMATTFSYHNVTNKQTRQGNCKCYCSMFQFNYQLFCNHIPLASLLNGDETVQNCSNQIKEILNSDAVAEQNYLDFERIMDHYATYQNYTVQANKSICLRSYKLWICSVHHTLYRYNRSSCNWVEEKPCLSLCSHTQASCPFFRIGDKSKVLGSQPVFLCQGLSDINTHEQREKCYTVSCGNDIEDGHFNVTSEPHYSVPVKEPGNLSPGHRGTFYLSPIFISLLTLMFAFFIC